jgi:hypothetical protein
MKYSLLLILLLGFAWICGCTSSGVWFATTRMEFADYREKPVAVLPVAVLPGLEVNDDLKNGLQQAVIQGLSAFHVGLKNVTVITQQELDELKLQTEFPWTPARIGTAARQLKPQGEGQLLHVAAAIGISVTAVVQRDGNQPAAISVLFVFADKDQADKRRWAMAGTWSDNHFPEIVKNMKRELGSYLIDLRSQASRGGNAFVSETYDADQPFVTVFGRNKDIFGDTAEIAAKTLRLQVTGIDDSGIENVEIRNDEAHFWTRLYANVKGNQDGDPIYFSSYINVPLIFGPNTIHVTAISSNGKSTTRRPIKIRCTTRPGLRILSLGISDYDDFDPVPGAGVAAQRVESAFSRFPGRTPADSMLGVDKQATASNALNMVSATLRSAALDDQIVFYFAGRLVMVSRRSGTKDATPRAYLALSDASTGSPGLGSLSIADVNRLLHLRDSVGVLDLCTDEPTADVTALLMQSLPQNAAVRVSRCDGRVGGLADGLVAWSLLLKGQSPNTNGLVAWLSKHIPESFAGKQAAIADAD